MTVAGDPKIQIDITARDTASDQIEDVAGAAGDLEKLTPEVTVTADTAGAKSDIGAVSEAADTLSRADTELVIRAKIDQAKGELKALQTELDATGDKARDTSEKLDKVDGGGGSGLRGNAIADLTGPLGDASGAASDFAGVFDGLGDTIEAAAGKLGASEAMAGKLAGAVGGLGVVVAAGAAAWTLWKGRQEEAAKKAKELLDTQLHLNDAMAKGDAAAATADFSKLYGKALDGADALGLSTKQLVDYITGVSDVLPGVNEHIGRYNALADDAAGKINQWTGDGQANFDSINNQRDALVGANDELVKARDRYQDLNGKTKESKQSNEDLADALGFTEQGHKDVEAAVRGSNQALDRAKQLADDNTAALGRLHDKLTATRAIEDFQTAMVDAQKTIQTEGKLTEDQIRAVQDSIISAGEAANLTPIQIQAAINEVTPTDVDRAFFDTQSKINAKGPLDMNLKIHPELPPRLKIVTRGGTTLLDEALVPIASAAGSTNVTINMPRGSNGVDVVRQVAGQARRSGRRFGNPVVDYARS